MVLARLLVAAFAATGMIELAVDDTLCRKRGLTIYGTGMHHDPLIPSRAMKLVSWGHDWVVICLLLRCPFWSPTKVWALPIVFRLDRHRQGLTKGKKNRSKNTKGKKKPPGQRTRPELALELISLVAAWFPDRQLMVSGDSAYGGKSVLRKLPGNVGLIRHVHPKGALYEPAPPRTPGQKGAGRQWSIEVTFENSKQLLGCEDPATRTPKAVERTAPMALVLYSLIVLWFHQHGHRQVEYPDRPWYLHKEEPSLADQLSTLRRLSWQEKTRGVVAKRSCWKKFLAQIAEFARRAG
jgi:hypothetical protein